MAHPRHFLLGVLMAVMATVMGGLAFAQETPPADLQPVELEPPPPPSPRPFVEMETDRPDFTETTKAVPRGSLQVELGAFWDREDDADIHTWHVPEALLRLGIRDGTELRFVAPEAVMVRGDDTINAAGDIEVGLKQELPSLPGKIDLALMPMVTLPTGGRRVSANSVEGSATLLWSRDFGEKTELGGNLEFGVVRNDADSGMTFAFTPTVVLYRQFTEKWGGLIEYRGDFTADGRAGNLMHYAMTYKITPLHQLDVRFGHAVSRDAPTLLVGVGYSFRLDGLF